MRHPLFTLAACLLSSAAMAAPAGNVTAEHYSNYGNQVHVHKPHELPPPDLSQLKVPADFTVTRFARGLGNVRMLAVADDGTVYVTRREEADVLMLKNDGTMAQTPVSVAHRPGLHGIALHKGKVYLATVHEIFKGDIKPDGSFGPLEMIIHDLPDAGQHHTRTVQVGPDEMLYISVGSTCNECEEPNPEAATMLRASLDGKHREVFATGLRDTIGWGWSPQTGELWGADHGIDWFGDEVQQEEINHIEKGKHYGWPYFFADNQPNNRLDPTHGLTREDWKKRSTPMVLGYDAHSAPMQLAFYTGEQFPADYAGDAFLAMHGSWNREDPKGYEVVRIHFKNGQAAGIEPFVTGFLSEKGESGRPTGMAVAKDGSLLFSDDRNGVIYRVSYQGAGKKADIMNIPTAKKQVEAKTPLASKQLTVEAALQLSSADFEEGTAIPLKFSAYDQNISPALHWSDGPQGTQSYALLMEDPDAPVLPNPYIHWVAWNIPAGTLSLPGGLSTAPKLTQPKGMMQGANQSGTSGYHGPRPPEGDGTHHYHFQLFALDTVLKLPLGTTRDELLKAMKGHVLAVGETIGTFERPAAPKKP